MKKNDISAESMMNKRLDFIVKSFNHTHKKKYENYVVTGIWHRLRTKNLMIKPITQQLVRRPDGKYALLDLYFPAINLAVECDENQHFDPNGNYIPEDKLREYDVLKVLAALPVQPELMRIKAIKLANQNSSLLPTLYVPCCSPAYSSPLGFLNSKAFKISRFSENKTGSETFSILFFVTISAADSSFHSSDAGTPAILFSIASTT